MPKPQKYRDVVKHLKSQGWELLRMAAAAAEESAALIRKAHSANGVVRWFDDVKEEEARP